MLDWLLAVCDVISVNRCLPFSVEPPPVGGAYPDIPLLCPYAAAGHCYYEDGCPYLHGDLCDVCGLQVLHPHDPEQRKAHEKV